MEQNYNKWKQESYNKSQEWKEKHETSNQTNSQQFNNDTKGIVSNNIAIDNDSETIFKNRIKRDTWYDNNIFASYFKMKFNESDSWVYDGSISPDIRENPYEYNGYDIYVVNGNTEIVYLVPTSEYVAVPEIYKWEISKNSIELVCTLEQ